MKSDRHCTPRRKNKSLHRLLDVMITGHLSRTLPVLKGLAFEEIAHKMFALMHRERKRWSERRKVNKRKEKERTKVEIMS